MGKNLLTFSNNFKFPEAKIVKIHIINLFYIEGEYTNKDASSDGWIKELVQQK